jgi:hypothetical protein
MAHTLQVGDASILRLRLQALNVGRALKLRNEIRAGIECDRTKYFLDLRLSSFLAPEALTTIAGCANECSRAGGWLILVTDKSDHMEAIGKMREPLYTLESIDQVGAVLRGRQAVRNACGPTR